VAGIVIKNDFIQAGTHRAFEQYINYINRKEKTEEIKYTGYFDYVDRDRTAFTLDKDVLTDKEIQLIKNIFTDAQEKGSNLWRSYISFDHEYLEECGILKNNMVDDVALQAMTKKYMTTIIKKEEINHAYWVGAIHYDTDNVHIHTSLIQTEPDREKGKFKLKSLEIAKSAAVWSIDKSQQNDIQTLNDLLRNKMINKRIGKTIETASDLMMQYDAILEQLPQDRRQWKYNMNALATVRPEINRFIDHYLETMKPSELKEFNHLVEKIEDRTRQVYGDTTKSYAENKRQDLYSRMGNALLKDMLEISKERDAEIYFQRRSPAKTERSKEGTPRGVPDKKKPTIQDRPDQNNKEINIKSRTTPKQRTINQIRRMHYLLNDEWEHHKNELVYDQLQANIEYGV